LRLVAAKKKAARCFGYAQPKKGKAAQPIGVGTAFPVPRPAWVPTSQIGTSMPPETLPDA